MSTDSPNQPRDGIQSEDLVKELLQAAGWHVVKARKASDAGRANGEKIDRRSNGVLLVHEDILSDDLFSGGDADE